MRRRALYVCAALGALVVAGCGGGSSAQVIAPQGAPYSYTVPSGFEEIEGKLPDGQEQAFLTMVRPEGTDREGYLNAYEWTLGPKEKAYPEKRLLAFLDEATRVFYKSEGVTVAPGKAEEIAGHRAVCWKVDGFKNEVEGVVDADSCAVVLGHRAIEQSCSWKPATRAAMERGCEELRASLKVG